MKVAILGGCVSLIGRVMVGTLYVGFLLALLYGLVRFVKWAWDSQ